MTLPKGSVEILRKTENENPASFTDYTEITIDGENLSSATISKRIKELVALQAIEETPTRSDSGRKTVGYELTDRGNKILEIANELENELEELE